MFSADEIEAYEAACEPDVDEDDIDTFMACDEGEHDEMTRF